MVKVLLDLIIQEEIAGRRYLKIEELFWNDNSKLKIFSEF